MLVMSTRKFNERGIVMDHVIADLKRWLEMYEQDTEGDRDKDAIICIKNAIRELNKYYSK